MNEYKRLYSKIAGRQTVTKRLDLPFSMKILKRSIAVKIPSDVIYSLHFIDLEILLFSFEIDTIREYIKQIRNQKHGNIENRNATNKDVIDL